MRKFLQKFSKVRGRHKRAQIFTDFHDSEGNKNKEEMENAVADRTMHWKKNIQLVILVDSNTGNIGVFLNKKTFKSGNKKWMRWKVSATNLLTKKYYF